MIHYISQDRRATYRIKDSVYFTQWRNRKFSVLKENDERGLPLRHSTFAKLEKKLK